MPTLTCLFINLDSVSKSFYALNSCDFIISHLAMSLKRRNTDCNADIDIREYQLLADKSSTYLEYLCNLDIDVNPGAIRHTSIICTIGRYSNRDTHSENKASFRAKGQDWTAAQIFYEIGN